MSCSNSDLEAKARYFTRAFGRPYAEVLRYFQSGAGVSFNDWLRSQGIVPPGEVREARKRVQLMLDL